MFIIPIYFQVTKGASLAVAGAYLIPAIVGNTTGGLLTGAWIKRFVISFDRRPLLMSSDAQNQNWSL